MSIDAAFARLREANPVPRPEALRDAPLDVASSLLTIRQRSRDMQTDVQPAAATRPTKPVRRRWVPALAVAVIGIVAIGAAAIFVSRSGNDLARAEDVARSFIEARNDYDTDTAISLLAPVAVIEDFVTDPAGYRDEIAYSEAVGWTENVGECAANPAAESTLLALRSYGNAIEVTCMFGYENDWSRALGVGPFEGRSRYRFVVDEGVIIHLIHTTDIQAGFTSVWEEFRSWIFENHSPDIGTLYNFDGTAPRRTPEAIALWKQRTEEFVAQQGN